MTKLQRAWKPLALALGLALCAPAAGGEPEFTYQDLPHDAQREQSAEQINAFVVDNNLAAQRAHAWALWEGLTAGSRSLYHGQPLPIWQTWFSDKDTFRADAASVRVSQQSACCSFEEPLQSREAHAAFGGEPDRVMAFVRFNRAAHDFIIGNAYNRRATLDRLVANYDRSNRPVQLRSLRPFPRDAVVLKATLWLIKNPHGRHGPQALTPLPYWDAGYPPPSRGRVPVHLTWRRCVAVDPDNAYPEGATAPVHCNGRSVQARIVHLDRFESLRLSDASDVALARKIAKIISMETAQEHLVTDPFTPELGDRLMLTAMHVMTREIDNWTFQTFWWTPFPNAAPFGNDRPAGVRAQWRNYAMCTAYSEDLPRTASGGPHVCFNPYLESDLGPTKPFVMAGVEYAPDPMAGTRSNCMACHARAGWPAKLKAPFTTASNLGRVFNSGYVPRNAPYYRRIVTTDMLWSIPLEAGRQPPAVKPSGSSASRR